MAGLQLKRHPGPDDGEGTDSTGQTARVLSRVPAELWGKILSCLLTSGSITTYTSAADEPQLSPSLVESRKNLASACLAFQLLHGPARRCLYHVVTLRSTEELLCFFRTLVTNPELRPLVRRFNWVGNLSSDNPDHYRTERLDQQLLADCWQTNWPATADDMLIARIMNLKGPDTVRGWNLFGATLGLIPKVKSLFILNGRVPGPRAVLHSSPSSPEVLALIRLLDPRSYAATNEAAFTQAFTPWGWSTMFDGSNRFLGEIENIFIEPHSDDFVRGYPPIFVLRPIMLSANSLRRVHIKGWSSWKELHTQNVNKRGQLQAITSTSVHELLCFQSNAPQTLLPGIVSAFPKLTKLLVEFDNGSYHVERTPELSQVAPTGVSRALSELKETLVTLHLATTPGKSWGHAGFPPLLSLSGMKTLKYLTTESIWLFGKQNPAVAYKMASLLPPSLVEINLIDFWGIAKSDPRPRYHYYPAFPQGIDPLKFMELVFQNLRKACPTHLPNLRTIILTSSASSPTELEAALGIQRFRTEFEQEFAEIGVRFSLVSMADTAIQSHALWANIH